MMMRRRHSTPKTLAWLDSKYEPCYGVCIPRNHLYKEYVAWSQENGMTPLNAASFGKIIRKKYPHLTTRRLGTRGQSKYHYYGLQEKEDSSRAEVGGAQAQAPPPSSSFFPGQDIGGGDCWTTPTPNNSENPSQTRGESVEFSTYPNNPPIPFPYSEEGEEYGGGSGGCVSWVEWGEELPPCSSHPHY